MTRQICSRVFPHFLEKLGVEWGVGLEKDENFFAPSLKSRSVKNQESHTEKYFPWCQETVELFNQIKTDF